MSPLFKWKNGQNPNSLLLEYITTPKHISRKLPHAFWHAKIKMERNQVHSLTLSFIHKAIPTMYRLWESKMFKKQVLFSKYSLQSIANTYLQHLSFKWLMLQLHNMEDSTESNSACGVPRAALFSGPDLSLNTDRNS